jgi:hypothetical protein
MFLLFSYAQLRAFHVALLIAGCTLDEVGFEGGTRDDPRTEILEYDYQVK